MRSSTVQDGLQVTLVLTCGSALAGAGHVLGSADRLSTAPGLEPLLGAGLSVVGVMIVAAWILTFVVALVAAVLQRTGRPTAARVAARCTPAAMRRLAVALVGVNLLALPAVAQASPGSVEVVAQQQASHSTPAGSTTASTAADGRTPPGSPGSPYWSVEPRPESIHSPAAPDPDDGPRATTSEPDEPDEPGTPTPRATPPPEDHAPPAPPGWTPTPMPAEGGLLLRQEMRPPAGPLEVVVAPGDSLWSIVAAHLGPSASSTEVAEAWPAWFEANGPTIGDDPSLLIPGQVLRAPQH